MAGEVWKDLKRRMNKGEIVMAPDGTARWNPSKVFHNIRCIICKEAKPKTHFKGHFRACKACKKRLGIKDKSVAKQLISRAKRSN